ncbi:unnamed protein product [Dovyalis caffra]|uniref:Beta'-coat protein n=1 Tax=Dovyalis caffra TaxID=77055 RepID=A0AAV1SSE0_9ROSI|nr:unnamed protein product [Dovyalis caffra]
MTPSFNGLSWNTNVISLLRRTPHPQGLPGDWKINCLIGLHGLLKIHLCFKRNTNLEPVKTGRILALAIMHGCDLMISDLRVEEYIMKGWCSVTGRCGVRRIFGEDEASPGGVRSAKFIARKHWIVTGSDDKFIRVYNYETTELVKEFEAHGDYIRSVSVHPTLSCVMSSSDDKLIKLWDWEKGWECTQTFEGHSHYVMHVTFNPKDTSIFASASLDTTIKIWSLSSTAPVATLNGHSKGLNCVDFFMGGDKLYLLSGSDDHTVKVWDYETKSCVQTLEGHTHNVTSCCVHPQLPIIITTSEDNTIRLWDATTYRLENTLDYDLQRVWAVGCKQGSCQVAFGCDNGTTMLKVALAGVTPTQ